MKSKFIRFMREHHALKEYLMEIVPYSLDDLNVQFNDGGAEFVLCDGAIFFWKDAKTDIDWSELNEKWVTLLKEEEMS